ncbi:MAG: hypothetical protein MZU97_10315 [Bacillus subtilis]|nr:hypothetical protein [Bacillus subtilis]
MIQTMIILTRNSFYNNFSDDIIQYYSIIARLRPIRSRTGTLSWFNLNNYLGASFFSDVYYVPLDIFTFVTVLLGYRGSDGTRVFDLRTRQDSRRRDDRSPIISAWPAPKNRTMLLDGRWFTS